MLSESLCSGFNLLPAFKGVEARASNGSGDHTPVPWIVKSAQPSPIVVGSLNDGNSTLIRVQCE